VSDWFCPSLIVPHGVATVLRDWVGKQDWPEGTRLKDPESYHVTLMYSRTGYQYGRQGSGWHEWLQEFRTGQHFLVWPQRAEVFNSGDDDGAWRPVVLELGGPDAPVLKAYAEEMIGFAENISGLSPVTHGPYRPHVTVAVLPPGEEPPEQWMPPIPDYPLILSATPVELHALYDDRKARR
jgi:2'-5' RNA ligase